MRTYTMIGVDKVKDTETGGSSTNLDEPVLCEYNNGFGFTINGINPLLDVQKKSLTLKPNGECEYWSTKGVN